MTTTPNRSPSFNAVQLARLKKITEDNGKKMKIAEVFFHDPRGINTLSEDLFLDTANDSIPIQVLADAEAFAGVILAVISEAIRKGWSLNTLDDSFIYWAFVYISNLVVSAAKGNIPEAGDVPKWLAYLCQAVTRTSVKSRGYNISYNFVVDNDVALDWRRNVGPLVYGHQWNVGKKTASLVNGCVPIIGPPAGYTDENGRLAATDLYNFLRAAFDDNDMHKMTPINEDNRFTHDVSAFAVRTITPGGGYVDSGGWFKQLGHEVPIFYPVFGVFSRNEKVENLTRGSNYLSSFSGDTSYTGHTLITDCEDSLHVKTPPVFKFMDFNEYLSIVAYWVTFMIGKRIEDPEFEVGINRAFDFYETEVQCPLKLWEVALLLRAACMLAFSDSQVAGQTLYPRVATDASDNEFVSFVSGFGTSSIPGGSQMLLPWRLKEAIVLVKSNVILDSRGGKKNPSITETILGQMALDRLDAKNYKNIYVQGTATTEYFAFADDSGDAIISYIDGKSGNDLTAINDPSCLVALAERWNLWVNGQMNARHLSNIEGDSGPSILAGANMTLLWTNEIKAPPPNKQPKTKAEKKAMAQRKAFKERMAGGRPQLVVETPYTKRSVLAITSSYTPFTSAWESFQQYMPLPQNLVTDVKSPGDNTGARKMQALTREGVQMTLGEGEELFTTLDERHRTFASLMVRDKYGKDNAMDMFFMNAMATGDGGILGRLLSVVGNVFNGSPGGAVINSIAEAIPI